MSDLNLSDFRFLHMWPRRLFQMKDEKSRLLIKQEVPELKQPGVYILYKGEELFYVGRADKLFSRLHDHANKVTDSRYAHWDHFSAFALADTVTDARNKMVILEAILIAASPRTRNKSTPRFKPVRIPRSLSRITQDFQ